MSHGPLVEPTRGVSIHACRSLSSYITRYLPIPRASRPHSRACDRKGRHAHRLALSFLFWPVPVFIPRKCALLCVVSSIRSTHPNTVRLAVSSRSARATGQRTRLASLPESSPMSGLGFSVTELIQAIAKCKNIYDTFTDEYESAPSRIKEFVDTCKYLRDILEDFQSVLGDIYPQGISFGRTLDECNAFIKEIQVPQGRLPYLHE